MASSVSHFPIVIHVPHASIVVPDEVRSTLSLTDEELRHELLVMTDWYTDELFTVPEDVATIVRFPVSRLVVDPERFADNELEPMASKGMGVVYTRTSLGRTLRAALSNGERESLLSAYYHPHQQAVRIAVQAALEANGTCLVIDAHSFSSKPLPHEPDQSANRCHICIGTDEYHTPPRLVAWLGAAFERRGFTVAVNQPFSGTFVPTPFYRTNQNVVSVMIEVKRSLYMDERTGERLPDFWDFRASFRQILIDLVTTFGSCDSGTTRHASGSTTTDPREK